MSWIRRNWGYVAAALAIAAVVHVASVVLLPRLVMMRAFSLMTRSGGFNTMTHGKPVTAASRAVVRPSPDLLYSTCPYDLGPAGGRLRVHARAMPDTYWSVSLFDAETDNFYVLDDRHAKGRGFDLTIVGPGSPAPGIRSPTVRGVVLIRTLIDDEKRLARIDAARRGAGCELLN